MKKRLGIFLTAICCLGSMYPCKIVAHAEKEKDDVYFDYKKKYSKEFLRIGNFIKQNNLRVDTHPDQYCVINSINDSTIKSSIKILKFHYDLFKLMNIDSKMIIHVGSGIPNKSDATKRFINVFKNLDRKISSCIILENDDKIYEVKDVLEICKTLKIPMVLDYHHFLCNNSTGKIEDYLGDIFKTWDNTRLVPKIHFSSPKNSREFRTHSDYIDSDSFIEFMNILKKYNQDVDIMLEAKAKDEALFRLIRELKYKTNYKFINETTFEIEENK